MRMKNPMIVAAAATSLGGCSRIDGSMPMMHGSGGVFWLLWILVIAAVVYLIVIFSTKRKTRFRKFFGHAEAKIFESMKKDIEGR